jgi:serine/threonine protein kinase
MGACLSVLCVDDNDSRRPGDRRFESQVVYESRRITVPAISVAEKKSSSSNSPDRQRTPTAHRDTLSTKDAAERQQYAATATSPVSPTSGADPSAANHPPATKSPKLSWTKGELIGAGAFGRVFSGLNNQTGELIAVKQVGISKDEGVTRKVSEHVRALEGEVALLKNLAHENIVQYLGMERTDDAVNILLEYVPGGSIASILSKFGPLKENIIQIYTKQILQGLEYLHQQGIMHRDIKGANILIDNKGTVKLADFGASKRIEDIATIAGANSVRGTPYWMAPEVIKGLGHGRPADIWSLGCTVIEMATGKPPWSNYAAPVTAMFQIASTKEPPHFPAVLSKDAHDFLTLCFNRVPNQRPNATTLLQHPFIASAPARPSTQQVPQFTPAQQQQQQQQLGMRLQLPQQHGTSAAMLDQQPSGRLPALPKGGSMASKPTPSRMSPTKRHAQLASEASSGLPASSQPLQANRPQLPAQASPRLPQLSPRLAANTAAGANGRPPLSSAPPSGRLAVVNGQHPRPAQASNGMAGNLPAAPPPIRTHPAPAAQPAQQEFAAPASQQQHQPQQHQPPMPSKLTSPLTAGQQKLRESLHRPNVAASYATLDYNPIEEPSWMPGYLNHQQQAALQAATAGSVSSSLTGTSGFSRSTSRRNTIYDDDDDQQSSKGRVTPTKMQTAAGAAAQERKPATPRSGPLHTVADTSAGNGKDTESDVDQPARPPSHSGFNSGTPKAAGSSKPAGAAAGTAADGRVNGQNGRVPGLAAQSEVQQSKKDLYIHELGIELEQARREMRATMNLGSRE